MALKGWFSVAYVRELGGVGFVKFKSRKSLNAADFLFDWAHQDALRLHKPRSKNIERRLGSQSHRVGAIVVAGCIDCAEGLASDCMKSFLRHGTFDSAVG